MIPRELAQRLDAAPFDAGSVALPFALDDADDHIDLAPGAYRVELDTAGTSYALCRIGAAQDVPADKASGGAGSFWLAPGASDTFVVGGGVTVALHARMVTAGQTGTLRLTRLVL